MRGDLFKIYGRWAFTLFIIIWVKFVKGPDFEMVIYLSV